MTDKLLRKIYNYLCVEKNHTQNKILCFKFKKNIEHGNYFLKFVKLFSQLPKIKVIDILFKFRFS